MFDLRETSRAPRLGDLIDELLDDQRLVDNHAWSDEDRPVEVMQNFRFGRLRSNVAREARS